MANQSEKRKLEANRKRLRYIFLSILIANAWYIFWRMIIQRESIFWFNYCSLIFVNAVYFVSYGILSKSARPVYSASKELISGGTDLSLGGFLEYVHDAIILMAILQFLGVITDWAWWLILVVPSYACYHAWKYYQQFKKTQQLQEPAPDKNKLGRKIRVENRPRR
eukprot:g6981.t1